MAAAAGHHKDFIIKDEDESLKGAKPKSSTWRVVLFRAVRDGDLDKIRLISERHPYAIHECFTAEMHDWELQYDSVKWFEYRQATVMFLAAAHSHPHIVEYLLENGVDADTDCGHNQKAMDVIGHSNYDPARCDRIRRLLLQPKKAPKPPPAPTVQTKLSHEESVKIIYVETPNEDPSLPPLRLPKRVTEVKVNCKSTVAWKCFWLSPGVDYQLRYRVDPADPRSDDFNCKWVFEESAQPIKTVANMRIGRTYQFQVRAHNAGGWSEWSEMNSSVMPEPRSR